MASATTSPAAPTLSAVAATYRHWYTQPIIEPARICANDSRWVAGIGNRFDDGLLALPRRGFKSRILHHTTNQGYRYSPLLVCFYFKYIHLLDLFHKNRPIKTEVIVLLLYHIMVIRFSHISKFYITDWQYDYTIFKIDL